MIQVRGVCVCECVCVAVPESMRTMPTHLLSLQPRSVLPNTHSSSQVQSALMRVQSFNPLCSLLCVWFLTL